MRQAVLLAALLGSAACGCALLRAGQAKGARAPGTPTAQAIRLDLNNVSVSKALEELKSKTGLGLVYSPSLLREKSGTTKTVSVRVESASPEKFLEAVAYACDLDWELLGENLYAVRPKSNVINLDEILPVEKALGTAETAAETGPAQPQKERFEGYQMARIRKRPFTASTSAWVKGQNWSFNVVFQKLDDLEIARLNEVMPQAVSDGNLTLEELTSFFGQGSSIQGAGLENHLQKVKYEVQKALADGRIDRDEIERIQEWGADPLSK